MTRYDLDSGIPTLAVALAEHMNADELKVLATLTKTRAPTRKAELVEHIREYLEGDRLRTVWQGLDDLQKAAVAEVVHSSDTTFPAERFRAKYGRLPDFGAVSRWPRDQPPTALRFFFYAVERGGGVMPDDLKERLEAFVPPPVAATVKSLEELPAAYDRPFERWNARTKKEEHGTEPIPLTVRETERSAQRELLSVLRLVDAGRVAVSDKTRRASSATVDAITAVLEGGDYYPFVPPKDKWCDENAGPVRAFAWPLLIQAGGLAQRSGSRLTLTRANDTRTRTHCLRAGERHLVVPASSDAAFRRALRDVGFLLAECVKGQTGKGKHGLTAASSRREAIADTLAECPVHGWIAAAELLRLVRASDNGFAVSRNAWHLYIGELQYGSLGYEGGAGLLEERYLLCLLFEYAATLGLVDVAFIPPAGARRDYHSLWGTDDLPFFSRYDGLMFVRVTALGAYCLGTAEDYKPAPVEVKPVLRVLPNLDIAAIGADLEPGDRLALDAYAVRTADLVWQLEAGKLLAAIEEGRSVDEIREFLSDRSGAPLPDTVARLLEDVAERGARVHDRGLARLIECADPALAALIANDTRTRTHCLRAGERHLVVPASSDAAFRRALRDVGFLLAPGGATVSKRRRAGATEAPNQQGAEA
ncbi:MAG: helicase-associated domain-containing protein [Candidatus Rokubacteria bacterium]|nr:helicase-associated domain-containing protein [Candidatus Rokubacteria bacterium]